MNLSKKIAVVALLAIGPILVPGVPGADLSIGIKFGRSSQNTKLQDFGYAFTNDSGTTYGFRMRAKSGMFGLEVGYFYASQAVTPAGAPLPLVRIDRLKLSSVSFNLLCYVLPILPIKPYLSVGYGTYRLELDPYAKDSNDGFNLGGGVDLRILKSVSLSAEGKYHWVNFNLNGIKFDVSAWTWNIGVDYHF